MTANSVAPISDCPREQYQARVHVLPHIKRLDDCFGQFLVRVICDCGACREIEPEALACLVGWKVTLRELALDAVAAADQLTDRQPHRVG